MTHLNIIDGLRFWSKKFDASSLSVFWYPWPAPRVIVPFSRNGPQSVPSGLDRGICVNNTVGLSIFSTARRQFPTHSPKQIRKTNWSKDKENKTKNSLAANCLTKSTVPPGIALHPPFPPSPIPPYGYPCLIRSRSSSTSPGASMNNTLWFEIVILWLSGPKWDL
jgi:hypothetical protein